MHTIATLMGLFILWMAVITSTDPPSPMVVFQGWPFILALTLALMALFYIWYKGYVLLDNETGVVTIKLYQKKFLGSIQFRYEDMAGIHLKFSQMINNSNKVVSVYQFIFILKSGDSHKTFKVYRKNQARHIKNAIAAHLDIEISQS